jgi:hypothetical protein
MSSKGQLAEEMDLNRLKTVKKKLFCDDAVAEAAGGRIYWQ